MREEQSKELIRKGISTITRLKRSGQEKIKVEKSDKKTISYKDAKPGKIDINEFKKAVYLLLEADDYLYKKAPKHELDEKESKEFCKLIIKCQNHLNKILSNFGFEIEEKDIDEDALYIVSNKKLFKKLKNKNPNLKVVCTEGMLDIEDMKKIGVPENALVGLKKKIELARKNIERFIEKYKPEKILVVIEDKKDELLYIRAKELYNAEKIDVDELLD
ncbi:Protein of unknown function DUF2100 [Methanocaldococcus vulcanius M7]|uniref:DUF2100 domain-containing protein n=1 Tax=Methanocaldococcus vulcanius (strain ATCC 700851 / DSM 12094 / M7) TaxID=579137 RepID=C9RHR0_METVM|nr:DUF2100 domain-containing protein [Methanocaldococcus vulcanius]ACX73112.1 Protein of unknown function DUF2100 [Methanocaldococcus vulcanius M7]